MEKMVNYAASVQQLIRIAEERKEGYRKAAEKSTSECLIVLFERYAEQSECFFEELSQYIEDYHPDQETKRIPAYSESLKMWMDIHSALSINGENALLNACIRSDENAIEHYERAIDHGIPMEMRSLVNRQYAEICKAVSNIKLQKV